MEVIIYLRAWLSEKFGERGAAATEYVLLILGVVLFMIVAAFVLPRTIVGITEASTTRRPSTP